MRLFLRQRRPTPGEPGIAGTVRVDPRTKSLTKRLRPGDIAVIDHLDLDRVSAEALAACRPAAVLNAARSTSGRYPNLGPGILLEAGIPLVDDLGPDVLTLEEGRRIRVVDAAVHDGERLVAEGTLQDAASVAAAMEDARAGLATQLEAFAANTMDYLRRERELLLDGVGVPDIATVIDGRQVLIVVRGYHYKEDLVTLRPYIKEYRPVLIGVDGGAVLLDVRAEGDQVLLVVVAPDDDEHLSSVDDRGDVRDPDAVQQQLALPAQVVHRVSGEGLQLRSQAGPGVLHRRGHRGRILERALRDQPLAVVHGGVHHPDPSALLEGQHVRTEVVDQRDARLEQDPRAQVGVPARRRAGGVEHRGRPARGEGLGRHAVEVEVVDHRDVAGPQPLGQALGPGVNADGAGDPRFSGRGATLAQEQSHR